MCSSMRVAKRVIPLWRGLSNANDRYQQRRHIGADHGHEHRHDPRHLCGGSAFLTVANDEVLFAWQWATQLPHHRAIGTLGHDGHNLRGSSRTLANSGPETETAGGADRNTQCEAVEDDLI